MNGGVGGDKGGSGASFVWMFIWSWYKSQDVKHTWYYKAKNYA